MDTSNGYFQFNKIPPFLFETDSVLFKNNNGKVKKYYEGKY